MSTYHPRWLLGALGQDVQLSYHETKMLSGLKVKDADELRDFTTRQGDVYEAIGAIHVITCV
jgi:hypothetical protein